MKKKIEIKIISVVVWDNVRDWFPSNVSNKHNHSVIAQKELLNLLSLGFEFIFRERINSNYVRYCLRGDMSLLSKDFRKNIK